MKVQSLILNGEELAPVEVELALWPGLPTITFLGLPDQHLKESALRIKSAIKHQGFKWPSAQQIIVNLRPSYMKKNSRGIELAVAAAYLWETGQVQPPDPSDLYYVYGELSLTGEVFIPEGLQSSFYNKSATVLTGPSLDPQNFSFHRHEIQNLQDLQAPTLRTCDVENKVWQRPDLNRELLFSKTQADLLSLLAVGEHSCLMAGPSGSGKTTMAKALNALLSEPWIQHQQEIQKLNPEQKWRPFIKPHHSTPAVSMIGGSSSLNRGEICRAHGGILLLDELLEFNPQVQEALREPFEEGRLRIVRSGKVKEYLADSLIMGTTNLCPCGEFIPGKKILNCRFGKTKCHSYSKKLSGPLVDRFQVLAFTDYDQTRKITMAEILAKVQKAQAFQQKSRAQQGPNSKMPLSVLQQATLAPRWLEKCFPQQMSERRRLALFRVARTLADLEEVHEITPKHLQSSAAYSLNPFQQIQRWEY